MEIISATPNQIQPEYTLGASNNTQNEAANGVGIAEYSDGGDTVLFSPMALTMSASGASNPFDPTTFSTTSVTTKLGNDMINYNKDTGAVTFNGQKLNLTGIADGKADDLVFQKDGGFINVYKGGATPGTFRLYVDGTQVKNEDGSIKEATKASVDGNVSALYLNHAAGGGAGDDVIINTKETAVSGGAGNDKIFNYAAGATSIDGGAGKNSIYTVGLSGTATITTGTGTEDGYLKIIGNMAGGTINLGKGNNEIDATGYSLNNVSINDDVASKSTFIMAKSISGSGTVKLQAEETGLKVSTLESNLEFGTGKNALIADVVKGNIVDKGAGSYEIKIMDGATIDASGSSSGSEIKISGSAKGSTFKLGKGANSINAAGKTLDSVVISDTADNSTSTSVVAGNIIGASKITLTGNTATGNSITVSGAIKGVAGSEIEIDTGAGKGSLTAGSIANAKIKMDAGGTVATNVQNVFVKGSVANTDLTTGKANDSVYIGGSVTGGTFSLAEGDDSINIGGAINGATFKLGDGANAFMAKSSTGVAQTLTNTSISSTGTADTDSTSIIAGAYKVTDATKGIIDLQGKGSNDIILNSIAGTTTAKASVTIGAADSDRAQSLTVKGAVSNAGVTTGKGADTILINGGVSNSDFDLGAGTNSFTAVATVKGKQVYQTLSNVNIDASGDTASDATAILAGAYKAGAADNHISLGNGINNVTLNSIAAAKAGYALEIMLGASTGDQVQTLNVNGNVSNATVKAGTGNDVLNIKGAVGVNTSVDLNDGDNTFTVGKSATGLTYVGTDADGKDDIKIGGAVSNSTFNLGEGTNRFEASAIVKGKTVYQTLSNVDITASGSAETDATTINAGAFKNGKTISNKIELGYGKNEVNLTSISGYNSKGVRHDAQIILGSDTVDFAQKLKVTGSVNGMDYIGKSKGADTIEILGALANASFEVGAGDNSLTVGKSVKGIGYTGTDGKDDVSFGGAVTNSNFDLGAGTNSFTAENATQVLQTLTNVNIDASGDTADDKTIIKAGAFKNGTTAANHIILGNGNNDVTLNSITGYKSKLAQYNLEMKLGSAGKDFDQALTVKGAISGLDYLGASDGVDKITVNGAITNATFDLGKGNNELLAVKEDKAGKQRGQTLTDVTITALDGDDTIGYGTFKATKLTDSLTSPSAVIDLGTGADKINVFA